MWLFLGCIAFVVFGLVFAIMLERYSLRVMRKINATQNNARPANAAFQVPDWFRDAITGNPPAQVRFSGPMPTIGLGMSQEDALDAIRDSLESSRVKIRNKVYQRIVILDPPVERSASRFGGKRGEKAIEYAFAYAYPGHHKIFRFTIFNGSVVDVEQRTIEEGEHRLALPLLETLDES